MAESTRRIELVIVSDDGGSQVVAQRDPGGPIDVITHSSLDTARAWVEAHYQGVEWRGPRHATALVGRLACGAQEPGPSVPRDFEGAHSS
jgi:hypothetical protein